jgi:hypothetical protein
VGGPAALPLSMKDLDALTNDDVVRRYDHWVNASDSIYGTNGILFWRSEIEYRRQRSVADDVRRLTRWIAAMTAVITVATIVNVILFAIK